MSEISSRPRVREVSAAGSGAVVAASVAAVVAAAGLRVVSAAVKAAVDAWSARSNAPTSGRQVKSLRTLREMAVFHETEIGAFIASRSMSDLEARKATELLKIMEIPYLVEGTVQVESAVVALSEARSFEALNHARQRLTSILESEHLGVMRRSLAEACASASARVGFSDVEMSSESNDLVRVIASDESGRSLVSEIRTSRDGDPSIDTEVVGVTDGSCHDILDRFDRALEEDGVQSAPADRRWTGGACQLAAARDFVQRELTREREAEQRRAEIIRRRARRTIRTR